MSKRETEAQKSFRKELARMLNDLRQFVDAPFLLIGKAAIILLDLNQPVTKDAIKELVTTLEDEKDAALVARTIEVLEGPSIIG